MYVYSHGLLNLHGYRYPLRVESMQLQLEFKEKVAEIQPSIGVLQQAIDEITSCETLREVFYIVLLTGNIINGVCEGEWEGEGEREEESREGVREREGRK